MSRLVCIIEFRDPSAKKLRRTLNVHPHHLEDHERLGALVHDAITETLVAAVRESTGGLVNLCTWCTQPMVPFQEDGRTMFHCGDVMCRGHEEAHES